MKKFMLLFSTLLSLLGMHARADEFALNAKYHVDTVWATAFQATVTLANNSNASTSTWTASFALPNGYSLTSHVSGGQFTIAGQNVMVKNLPGNGVVGAGASTTFTMLIEMPRSMPTIINNLQATANSTESPTPPITIAPTLNLISIDDASFVLSWTAIAGASSYTLQQDTSANFTAPIIASSGNLFDKTFTNLPNGTYYYRVAASNASGSGPFSNVESIEIARSDNEPPQEDAIEHSAWYIDWTSWFDGPPFVIPAGNNLLNIFVGELTFGIDGKPTLGGFGNFTLPQIDAFTAYCASQEPPIAVKVSIGGAGGMYDRCWDRLTPSNIRDFAQGMADFCHAHGLAGVDFDYEAFVSEEQEVLVGTLIKEFKAIDPNFRTSLCTNAGFGPNFPWQNVVKRILDAATISPGNCAVDRLYIMSYYNSMEVEQNWILGWSDWVIHNYGFTPARVSVGIDDFDAHAYDPIAFAAWAASMGFSTAHWAFDPARPK